MNRTIIGFLGKLIILVGLSMVVPLLMSVYDNEHIMDVYLTFVSALGTGRKACCASATGSFW